ncbi:family 35 glycosyl hydrolase [Xylariaceae sp. FL0804]|nr:family 35 glycosyl hydrolase [Xylariaceae sp. FL0804]
MKLANFSLAIGLMAQAAFGAPTQSWPRQSIQLERQTGFEERSGTAIATRSDVKHDQVLLNLTDEILYKKSLYTFLDMSERALKDPKQALHPELIWTNDGCSHAPDHPFGFDFAVCCRRHDFSYDNYKKQGRWNEDTRKGLDLHFKGDMLEMWLFKQMVLSLGFLGLVARASNDGLTTAVTWDPYSLMVNGERVFIYSGEFHYPRLPVPEMWRDVLEKFKANGMNTVSIYFFWSYHSAAPGDFDFSSPGKDVQYLLDICKEIGLYVIARASPYVNGESNGGGLALWGSDGSMGELRTSDETYHQAWLPWVTEISNIIAKNQVTENGTVILYQIENELQETDHSSDNTLVIYMEQLENATRAAGITVPFSSNEKGQRSESWSTDYEDVGGAVNVYGLDSYPGGFSCTNVDSGFTVVTNYYQWFQNYSYTQPEFLPEFEGGYFQPWGGYFYDQCLAEHDPAFADVYYKNNIGQRITLQNLYMGYGGTNWGNLGAPVVYTSYDYSAPLRETREVQLKFKQTKLIGLFTRVSQDLLMTDMESNGTGNAVSSTDIYSWVLRNPDTQAGFYVLQHSTSSSRDVTTFSVSLNTSAGTITVPNVQLNGRQSKIAVTDYRMGNTTLLYSSSDIAAFGIFDNTTVLVLYADAGQTGEFAFKSDQGNVSTYGSTPVNTTSASSNTTLQSAQYSTYTYTQGIGSTVLSFSSGLIVYLLETETAWDFFAPATTSDPRVTPQEQIFVLGPYNVRNASVSGSTVTVVGDNANTTSIEVYAGAEASTIEWNGEALNTTRTEYGSLIAMAPGAADRSVELPTLSWKTADSLPERYRDYNDSAWVICNKTSSLSPTAPLTLPVLFSSDYGYYAGIKVYRGRFDGAGATAANVTAQGGVAAGWTAWLNGRYVGGAPADADLPTTTSALLDLTGGGANNSNATTLYATDNVLTVVTDYTGHDETSTGPDGVENARGLLGAALYAGSGEELNFTQWRVQGQAGGSRANIDPVRGPMNEDGLYGTRLGWHLPGFDPATSEAAWSDGSPLQGLNASGIRYYVASFALDLDADLDVPLGMELDAPAGTVASVQLYVNGYQYGKFIPQIGPQTRFPFPPGVVNNRGNNTVALALWAQTDAGARLSNATLFAYNKYQTGFDFNQDWSALQPGWTDSRLQYA